MHLGTRTKMKTYGEDLVLLKRRACRLMAPATYVIPVLAAGSITSSIHSQFPLPVNIIGPWSVSVVGGRGTDYPVLMNAW